MRNLENEIPSFGVGSDVANLALTKVAANTARNTGMRKDIMIAVPWYSGCIRR